MKDIKEIENKIEKETGKLTTRIIKTLWSQFFLQLLLFLFIAVLFLTGIWGFSKFNQILAIFNFGVLGISMGLK